MSDGLLYPDWPAPPNVRALVTTRKGGVSTGPYASLNLGDHVDDAPAAVARNRALLRCHLPAEPLWLKQVHGRGVAAADSATGIPEADAAVARQPRKICAVLTADCLPVLFCDDKGAVVAAAHAGWRGLAGGVLEAAIDAMGVPPQRLLAWLGPAIGPQAFEVGGEVRDIFTAFDPAAALAFQPRGNDKWQADIFLLARQRLQKAGLTQIHGGGLCTVSDPEHFFSYRRDSVTGRMASLVWLE